MKSALFTALQGTLFKLLFTLPCASARTPFRLQCNNYYQDVLFLCFFKQYVDQLVAGLLTRPSVAAAPTRYRGEQSSPSPFPSHRLGGGSSFPILFRENLGRQSNVDHRKPKQCGHRPSLPIVSCASRRASRLRHVIGRQRCPCSNRSRGCLERCLRPRCVRMQTRVPLLFHILTVFGVLSLFGKHLHVSTEQSFTKY